MNYHSASNPTHGSGSVRSDLFYKAEEASIAESHHGSGSVRSSPTYQKNFQSVAESHPRQWVGSFMSNLSYSSESNHFFTNAVV